MTNTIFSSIASRPQPSVDQDRRTSFGRTFERFRMSFRPSPSLGSASSPPVLSPPVSSPHSAKTQYPHNNRRCATPPSPPAHGLYPLVVDDDLDAAELSDEPFVALGTLGRYDSGIPEAKLKQLFLHHGLSFRARRTCVAEPPTKMRRIEKSIRMRVRWTCHSCSAGFAADKCCTGCGHRRCAQCHRDPVRKSKTITDNDNDTQPCFAGSPVQAIHTASWKPDEEPSAWQATIRIGRPRMDSYVGQSIPCTPRRDCHECATPFETVNQIHCTNCIHVACILCPISLSTTTTKTSPPQNDTIADAPMLSTQTTTVERVYKKPRQRVRYNCENCSTPFTYRHECSGCGHERCETCPRFPARKQSFSHDASVWAALEAKLATTIDPVVARRTAGSQPPLLGPIPLARL